MGNVDEGIKRTDLVKTFGNCNVYSKKCKNCFARFCAVAVVQPTHLIFMEQSMMHMRLDVKWKERE